MARSSRVDPIEKFRFKVTVLSFDPSLTGAVETIAGLNNTGNKLAILSRAGFQEVTLPKVSVSEMSYRENIDNQRFSKIPGLTKYEPISLKRGATSNRDLYDWFRLVNEELAITGVAQEFNQDAKYTPVQSESFRKEVVIEVLDREGKPIKGWILFNCWPNSYKPGNDLNAQGEEKLIEELTLTYEYFLELENGLDGLQKELLKGTALVTAAGATKGLPFLR